MIYVVEALRYGNREKHSYVVGVFNDIHIASRAAIAHEYWRGGKYECVIIPHKLNFSDSKELDFCSDHCLTDGKFAEEINSRANEYSHKEALDELTRMNQEAGEYDA